MNAINTAIATNDEILDRIDQVDVYSHRAWALTSMMIAYINQAESKPSVEVMSQTLTEIWEKLDAIGHEVHEIRRGQS